MIKSMYIMPLYTRLKSLPGTTLVGYCRPIKPVFITLFVFASFTIRAGSKKIPREVKALLQSSDFTSFFFASWLLSDCIAYGTADGLY